jgi:hypothetical protein
VLFVYGTRAASNESTGAIERAASGESTVLQERAESTESTVRTERGGDDMQAIHFYHAYLENEAWPTIVAEHLEALITFDGPVIVGAAGDAQKRLQLDGILRDAGLSTTPIPVPPESEQGTMELVRIWALTHPETAVLYASQPTDFNDRWRRSMAHHVVEGWENCRSILEEGYDAVGCHWLHPDVFGESTMGPTPFFGGNYWLATCAYLNTLPPVPGEDRWGSERWIGLGNPRVHDLAPGWPGDGVFAQVAA